MYLIKLIERNFGALLVVFGIIAFLFPHVFILGKPISDELLMIALFLGCLKIDFKEIIHIKKNVRRLVLFALLNLIVQPIVFYLVSYALPYHARMGLFLIAATSGAVVTPMLASFLKLRILWSTVYVVLTSMLLPFTLPFLTKYLFDISMEVSIVEMMLFLGKMVFLPFTLAILFKTILKKATSEIIKVSGALGGINMGIFFGIIVAVNYKYLSGHILQWDTMFYAFLMCSLFFFRFLLGFLLKSDSKHEKWTNSLMFGNMNNGIVILLASQFLGSDVLFVVLLSEIPWIAVQPIFQKLVQKNFD